jgi:hypothetical protein
MSISIPTTPSSAPAFRERFNLRLLGFIAIFAALLGWPLYLYLDATLTGGVKNRGNYFEVDLKAMSDFRFSDTEGTIDDVPKKWRELNSKTIVLEGEIAPGGFDSLRARGQFDLVYSVQNCCYSGPPQIQHFVKVTVAPTATFEPGGGAVRVKGTLKVDVTRDPETGKVNGVYHVLADGVSAV